MKTAGCASGAPESAKNLGSTALCAGGFPIRMIGIQISRIMCQATVTDLASGLRFQVTPPLLNVLYDQTAIHDAAEHTDNPKLNPISIRGLARSWGKCRPCQHVTP